MQKVESFLDELQVRGYSENTITAYRRRLDRFVDKCQLLPTDLSDLSRQRVQTYLSDLSEEVSRSSVAAHLTALRSWGEWLEAAAWDDEGWRNVFATFKLPRVKKYPPRIVGRSEIEAVVDAMPHETFIDKRNLALITLAYSSALRASEIAGLRLDDVDLDNGSLFIRNGKGGKPRTSVLSDRAIEATREWEAVRHNFSSADSPYLFIGRGTDGIGRFTVYAIVKQAGERAGIDLSPHTLRRSRATHLRNQGVRMDAIQVLLGHESQEVTSGSYVVEDPKEIRREICGS